MRRVVVLSGLLFSLGCSGSEDSSDEAAGESEADELGVASECAQDDDCPEAEFEGTVFQLQCLLQFANGYCAVEGCLDERDCPQGSTCVAHDDGKNYCFRDCLDKERCNANRSAEAEANCSANFDFASAADDSGQKACIPPSSGI